MTGLAEWVEQMLALADTSVLMGTPSQWEVGHGWIYTSPPPGSQTNTLMDVVEPRSRVEDPEVEYGRCEANANLIVALRTGIEQFRDPSDPDLVGLIEHELSDRAHDLLIYDQPRRLQECTCGWAGPDFGRHVAESVYRLIHRSPSSAPLTAEQITNAPVGFMVRVTLPDQKDYYAVRISGDGGASSNGWGLKDTRDWLQMLEWEGATFYRWAPPVAV